MTSTNQIFFYKQSERKLLQCLSVTDIPNNPSHVKIEVYYFTKTAVPEKYIKECVVPRNKLIDDTQLEITLGDEAYICNSVNQQALRGKLGESEDFNFEFKFDNIGGYINYDVEKNPNGLKNGHIDRVHIIRLIKKKKCKRKIKQDTKKYGKAIIKKGTASILRVAKLPKKKKKGKKISSTLAKKSKVMKNQINKSRVKFSSKMSITENEKKVEGEYKLSKRLEAALEKAEKKKKFTRNEILNNLKQNKAFLELEIDDIFFLLLSSGNAAWVTITDIGRRKGKATYFYVWPDDGVYDENSRNGHFVWAFSI